MFVEDDVDKRQNLEKRPSEPSFLPSHLLPNNPTNKSTAVDPGHALLLVLLGGGRGAQVSWS